MGLSTPFFMVGFFPDFGITEKEYLIITETLTGEVSTKTGKLYKSCIKRTFYDLRSKFDGNFI
jgi:hypothetical protein